MHFDSALFAARDGLSFSNQPWLVESPGASL